MAHATHFLSRLERLPTQTHVEIAMALYRNTPLVKRVLESSGIPEGAGRVALELGEGEHPACLVLERDGAFVTCLAPGMRHDLFTIPIGRLEHVGRQLARETSTKAFSRRLTGMDTPSVDFVVEVLARGASMTREQFLACCAWGDALHVVELKQAARSYEALTRVTLQLAGIEKAAMRHASLLERRERECWWMAHSLTLSVDTLRAWVAEEENLPEEIWSVLQWLAFCGVGGPAIRAFWVAARLGKPLLKPLKQTWTAPRMHADCWSAAVALVAIARAHEKLTAEVTKILERDAHLSQLEPEAVEEIRALQEIALGIVRGERPLRAFTAIPGIFDSIEESRQPGLANVGCHVGTMPTRTWMELVAIASVGLARAPAEELYLSKALLPEAFRPETQGAAAVARRFECLREVDVRLLPENQPPSVAPGEGRNAPCPCGSGRKRKRCCEGRAA